MSSLLPRYIDLLTQYVSFQTISTDPVYRPQLETCADWLCDLLNQHGFQTQQRTGYGNPLVYAHLHHDDTLPTILIYGHYDVQPAELSEWWTNDPFQLTERESRLRARGATDNKWQLMMHLVSVFHLIQNKSLKYNIIFLIEGDEETGGGHMAGVLRDHRDQLQADVALISDGEMIGNHTPTMIASFRGGVNMTVMMSTAKTDLHSGIFGNIAPSASHEMIALLSKLTDTQHRITIPGRYDSMTPISSADRTNAESTPFHPEQIMEMTGTKTIQTPGDENPVIANGLMPTIQVSGIQSGYTGNGYKNIIPATATAKLNFRFARGQDSSQMVQLFTDRVQKNTPDYVHIEVASSDPYDPITINTNHPLIQESLTLLSDIRGRQAVMRRCGAAVPIAGQFQDVLGLTVLIIDLANEDCNMHGVDENIDLVCVEKGLEISLRLLGKSVGDIPKI